MKQEEIIMQLISALLSILPEKKIIVSLELWLEGDKEPYISIKQRKVSDEIDAIIRGEGMYNGKTKNSQ